MPRIGGGNLVELFRVHPDHTGIIAASGTPSTIIVSPASSDIAFRFGGPTQGIKKFIVSQQWAQGEGQATLPINTIETSSELFNFLKIAAPFSATASATDLEEIPSEDGAFRVGGSAGSGSQAEYLAIQYSAPYDATIVVAAAIVRVSVSGFPNYQSNTFNQFQITLTTTPAKSAFTVPDALLDARVTAPGSPIVIPANNYLEFSSLVEA